MRGAEVRPHISQSSFGGEKEMSQLHISSGNCPLGSLSPPAGWLLGHVGFVSRKQPADFGGFTWLGVARPVPAAKSLYEVLACFLICRDPYNSPSS